MLDQSTQARFRLLQDMPIFGGINDDTLAVIVDEANSVNIPLNEYFFREGEFAHSMFLLEQGAVNIFRHWDGQQYELRKLHAGDCFGEMALMECSTRSASVQATSDCFALEISAAQLSELYEKFPEQYTIIQMNLGREVCRRLRDADTRLFINERKRSQQERVIAISEE